MRGLVWDIKGDGPNNPVFVEGLPGIGHVGQLVAEQLIAGLNATLWVEILSSELPPQAMLQEDGTVRPVTIRIYQTKGAKPLLIMTGDAQPLTVAGQYELVGDVLDRLHALGCREIYTLGGIDAPGPDAVVGAASDVAMVSRLKELAVPCPGEAPDGGILGASGLFIALAARRGWIGACLMGRATTLVDARGAEAVLGPLQTLLAVDAGTAELPNLATALMRRLQQVNEPGMQPESEHPYIG